MRYLLLLTFFTIGCAQEIKDHYDVNPDFEVYVKMFEYEAKIRGIDLDIVNLDMYYTNEYNGTNTLATCRRNLTPLISVSIEFWNSYGPSAHERVIFHELGHCILGRNHNNTDTVINSILIPRSIMNKYLIDDYYYDNFREYYITELFIKQTIHNKGEITSETFTNGPSIDDHSVSSK